MIFHFDQYTLDTNRLELRCGEEPIDLEPQVFSVLLYLIQNRDQVVSKDELIEAVWNGRIVSDSALNSRISTVRRALGDDGKLQSHIRTFPRRGFRFIAEVVENGQDRLEVPDTTDGPEDLPRSGKPSIIVLPFENMSSEPQQGYFSDGITEDIIAALSKHRWLAVVARSTSYFYKGKAQDVRRLADDVSVNYVVEGSVRRADNRVRITAQLTDATTGNSLWVERYDRELEHIFDVQDEITESIAAQVEPEIGAAERERVARAPRTNLQAWDYFHLGVSHFFKLSTEDNREAQRLLQLSRQQDPQFASARGWWAYAVYQGMVYWDTEPTPKLLDEALVAINRAIELDDQDANFYFIKARIQICRHEYSSALAESDMAIALNPSSPAAYCGLGHALTFEGRCDEAVKQFQKALLLGPHDPSRWASLGYGALALIFNKDYGAAVDWADRGMELPNYQYWLSAHKTVALSGMDQHVEARKSVENLMAEMPEFSLGFAERKLFYAKPSEQMSLYFDRLRMAGVPE